MEVLKYLSTTLQQDNLGGRGRERKGGEVGKGGGRRGREGGRRGREGGERGEGGEGEGIKEGRRREGKRERRE